jgi:hypothetical protein
LSHCSLWVGDRTGGDEASISGNGAPVPGVFGGKEDHAQSLGLLVMSRS